jgi:hypothetical protein
MTRRLATVAAALALALTGVACGNKPSRGDCEKLVRHLVDLESGESGASAVPADKKAEVEQQKKKVFDAVGLDYCLKDLSVEQVNCGLKAKTLEEISTTCNAG